MASGQELGFRIVATDQASAALNAINKKIQDFGKDIGKSIAAMVGPMALVTMAVGKVTDYLDKIEKKAKEAFDWGTSLSDNAAKMGLTVEQFQQISEAADKTGLSIDKVAQAFKLAADLIAQAKAGSKDAAASLEAMGINLADIDNVKPQDVLSKLSAALSATADPAQRAQIAMAALGKSAKDLQDVLAKGFDIAGALQNTEGLTTEEANFLRQQAREEAKIKNQERLKEARKQATERFLETDEGKAILERERNRQRLGMAQAGGAMGGSIASAITSGELASDPKIQAEIQRILAEREAARAKTAGEANPPNPVAAGNLIAKAATDAAKEAKKDKEPKGSKIGGQSNEALGSVTVKTPPLTVSSLREIGGGFAGEGVKTTTDLLAVQVDLQKSMLKELENLNNKSRDFQDPTKTPVPGGFIPGVDRMIA